MGDATTNRSTTPQEGLSNGSLFFQQKKRARTDAETPGNSMTPVLQLNDVEIDNASTETIIRNPMYRETDREKEHLTFKLDRLNDKRCRFESHEAFLNKCLTNNLIPNGLKVYIEPSIGNRDEEFLTQWHSRLDDFSKTLTADVVQYCEKEIKKTKDEIAEVSNKLKDLITVPELTDINKAISANEQSRVNELTQRKNRKFYRLKYHKNDQSGYGHRDDRRNDRRDDRRDGQLNRWNENNRRPYNDRERNTHDNSGHRDEWNRRNDEFESNNNPHRDYGNRRDYERRPGVSYANAARNGRNDGNSRRTSFRNLQTPQNNDDVPLHERVSLHRRNSRRNVTARNDKQEIEDLRRRLHQLENSQPEQVINHHIINQDTNAKNLDTAQKREMGQSISDITEMKSFLAGVMQTISEFDKRLTTQLSTDPTRSERS